MSFVTRLNNRGKKKKGYGVLSDIEETNDPTSTAAEHIGIASGREVKEIAQPRASSFYNACMRQHVLCSQLNKSAMSYYDSNSALTYAIGNMIHYWVQNSGDVFGNKRTGWWRCTACNNIRYFGTPDKKSCQYCGALSEATIYHEHGGIVHDPFIFSFHIDMFLRIRDGLYRVVEIKSIEGEAFKKLVAPLWNHEYQVNLYMMAMRFNNSLPIKVDTDVGYVLYVSKKHLVSLFPYKMFIVKRNNEIIKGIENRLLSYKRGMEDFPKNLPQVDEKCLVSEFNGYKTNWCPCSEECINYYRSLNEK